MPKQSQQFPLQFELIGRKTIKEGKWELILPNAANARSLRASWHSYVAALRREERMEQWVEAVRVTIRVQDNLAIFEDRNAGPVAKALDAMFAESHLELDKVGREFKEMMEKRGKGKEG